MYQSSTLAASDDEPGDKHLACCSLERGWVVARGSDDLDVLQESALSSTRFDAIFDWQGGVADGQLIEFLPDCRVVSKFRMRLLTLEYLSASSDLAACAPAQNDTPNPKTKPQELSGISTGSKDRMSGTCVDVIPNTASTGCEAVAAVHESGKQEEEAPGRGDV